MVVCAQTQRKYQYLIGEERRGYDKFEDREGVPRRDQTVKPRLLPLHITRIVQVHDRASRI